MPALEPAHNAHVPPGTAGRRNHQSRHRSATRVTTTEATAADLARKAVAERGFESFGVPFGIRGPSDEVLLPLLSRLPPCTEQAPLAGLVYTVRKDHALWALARARRRLATSAHLSDLADSFEQDIHLHVARHAPAHLFVHAAVVSWQGKAILLPGRSLAGKSTLVAALLRAGATYYSDEYAVLDAHGRVHPYPRRPSLPRSRESTQRPAAAELGASTGTRPIPVGMVAVLTYQPGGQLDLRSLSTSEAVMALLANTAPAQCRPHEAFEVLYRCATGAARLSGTRGEADQAAQDLLRLAES